MAFLKNLGEKIGSAAGSAADKAKRMAEVAKLNSAIGTEEKSIDQIYLEIGKQIFAQDKYNPDSPVVELCQRILDAQQKIEELQQEIANIKAEGTVVVAEGVEQAQDMQVEPAQSAESDLSRKFCTECGAENTPDDRFCTSCGSPMNQK